LSLKLNMTFDLTPAITSPATDNAASSSLCGGGWLSVSASEALESRRQGTCVGSVVEPARELGGCMDTRCGRHNWPNQLGKYGKVTCVSDPRCWKQICKGTFLTYFIGASLRKVLYCNLQKELSPLFFWEMYWNHQLWRGSIMQIVVVQCTFMLWDA
jgi:hypothetical protein